MEKIEIKKFEIDCKQKKIEIEWRRSTKISWDRLQARGDTRSNEEDRQKFLEIECNNQEIQDRLQEIESQKLKNGRRSNRRKSTRKKGSRKKFVKRSNWNFCSFQRVSRDLLGIPAHAAQWQQLLLTTVGNAVKKWHTVRDLNISPVWQSTFYKI